MFEYKRKGLPGATALTGAAPPAESVNPNCAGLGCFLQITRVMWAFLVCSLVMLRTPGYAQTWKFTPGNFYGSQGTTIVSYSSTGRQIASLQVPGAVQLRGIAFGAGGLLYAVNTTLSGAGSNVLAIDTFGRVRQTYSYAGWTGGNSFANKIVFDGRGHFYVGSAPGIVRFTVGDPQSGILVPNTDGVLELDVLPSGNLLAANSYQILEITSAGTLVRIFNSLYDITGVAYDRASNQVFATEYGTTTYGLYRLLRYDFTTGVGLGATTFQEPGDVVLASDGRLVVGTSALRQAPGIFDKNLNQIGTFQGGPSGFLTQLVVGYKPDFNLDAQSDLVWQNDATGDVAVWYMNGIGWTGSYDLLGAGVSTDWKVVGVADLNGDAKADLVWQNQITGDVSYWLMNGAQRMDANFIAYGVPTDWKIVAVTDLNGDGSPDFLWQNLKTGDALAWLMNGTQWAGSVYIAHSVPLQWKVVGTGDFNHDGNADLVWENTQTGDVTVWYMTGAQWRGNWDYLAQGVPTDWQVFAVADYNGDGQPDLIWQNRATGDVSYWLMGGIQRAASDYICRAVPLQWHIAGRR